jgi:hypothetical protein
LLSKSVAINLDITMNPNFDVAIMVAENKKV